MIKKSAGNPILRASLAAALVVLAAAWFSGCSSQSNDEDIVVHLTNVPSTLIVNQSVSLAATVSDDSSNKGVDWSAGSGTFSLTHTASGAATVFTAPATEGTATITATSTADSGAKASATITIVPVGSLGELNGRYVFLVQGVDSTGSYAAAGTIVADGNGLITEGRQDYTNASVHSGPDPLTGTYSIGPDGRGSITLTLTGGTAPSSTETFSIAVTSPSHALIIQFDGFATSSGTLDLQSASALDAAAISGAFSFLAQGVDFSYQFPVTYGGRAVLSASTGLIASSAFYTNDGGQTSSATPTGTMTAPDAFGRGSINLANGVDFAYYAVQGKVLRLIELDTPFYIAGGSMFWQGTAGDNSTFSNASLSGNQVLSESGSSVNGPLALAGQLTADAAGGLSYGVVDTNEAGTSTSGSIAGADVYAISANGTGTFKLPGTSTTSQDVSALLIFMVDPALNIIDPTNPAGGGGALVMDNDTKAVGSGFIVPQTAGTFQGNYAVGLQSYDSGGETDVVGQSVAADGALTGKADVNVHGTRTPGATLTGAFATDASNPGRFTGTITIGTAATRTIVYYQVSAGVFAIVETDATNVAVGFLITE